MTRLVMPLDDVALYVLSAAPADGTVGKSRSGSAHRPRTDGSTDQLLAKARGQTPVLSLNAVTAPA